jgi:hypothetical protein
VQLPRKGEGMAFNGASEAGEFREAPAKVVSGCV